MLRKNLLSLHESIVVALINSPNRAASFQEIADFIQQRDSRPNRDGDVSLADQVMLRSTKSKGRYAYLFEPIGKIEIRLKNL